MSISSQQCPGKGCYKHTAQNQGGYVKGAVVSLSAVYSTYGISYNHVYVGVLGYGRQSLDASNGPHTTEGNYGNGVAVPYMQTSQMKATHLDLCSWTT